MNELKLCVLKLSQEVANSTGGFDEGMSDADGMSVSQGNPLKLVKLAYNGALFHAVVKEDVP